MLVTAHRTMGCNRGQSRRFHTSRVRQVFKQLERKVQPRAEPLAWKQVDKFIKKNSAVATTSQETEDTPKRNEVGVQLLSRRLHSQIFKGVTFPPPDRRYINLAREHLESHGLDPTQGSVLPNTGFTLPPLQGNSIDEHFHRIGEAAARPWLDLAKRFAKVQTPPRPEFWHIHSGWTKYHHRDDGSSFYEPVSAPDEEMLSFDVETMPSQHHYAVMACAVSATHWYSWISPWLLGETEDPQQLIPLGDRNVHRVVVGHNVSYDRARLLEEYHVDGTNTRFIDTMSLHVAVKGISSHQRPAWMKYRKSKYEEKERKSEAVEAAKDLLRETQEKKEAEIDAVKRAELRRLQEEIEESLPQLLADESDSAEAETSQKRWEDITSANSLADVAKLHCGIEIEKGIRDDFMTCSREEIVEGIHDYLDYCASDVGVTHAVYKKVFPDFLQACPSPVSFAGVMTMGSSFLTVNDQWEEYLRKAESVYRELNEKIRNRLLALAEQARELVVDGRWKDDVWLSQLDWTPKIAGKSRGIDVTVKSKAKQKSSEYSSGQPVWFKALSEKGPFNTSVKNNVLPFLLRLAYDGYPLSYSSKDGWTYLDSTGKVCRPNDRNTPIHTVLGKTVGLKGLTSRRLTCEDVEIAKALASGEENEALDNKVKELAEDVLANRNDLAEDRWINQLNWKSSRSSDVVIEEEKPKPVLWPKWYWDLAKPKKGMPPGTLDLTIRSRLAPLLLKLSWAGWPLFHSRQHGWIFRVAPDAKYGTRSKPLSFYDPADAALQAAVLRDGYSFYKLPHKDGESANVGNPFGKTFLKHAQDGTLASPGDDTKDALDMNAQCSYWISSRDRILNQMVVWNGQKVDLGVGENQTSKGDEKVGMILPQVITMGAVTRRAIEKTWLTASNAKKNRVGSELKAMVQAPKGYAIVGADVDSEELWISSAMGDAQFGLHGATAIGWMTLEGTKAAGTDLHSKTASILGISRDQAKVFNYSRIYGAGMRHAMLLLLQSNPSMLPDMAQKQAEKLYASTKGKNTHRTDVFGRKFWFGGSESYVFNKLEEIAMSDKPKTPALGCGVTYALSKEYLPAGFGTDYMTSRINWVVQSSGVDYLHLLIVSMDYLISKYDIKARYLMSVHDELRYLVKEEDKYRAALALQVANLWTRCLFAFKLGMDDLPQGVAFFSAVDVDHVLRKEVDLPCITPSQPTPIPPGESLSITQALKKTQGGSLWRDGRAMQPDDGIPWVGSLEGYVAPDCLVHRASGANFLRAQATTEFGEIKRLAELETGQTYHGDIGGLRKQKRRRPQVSASLHTCAPSPQASWLDAEADNYLAV